MSKFNPQRKLTQKERDIELILTSYEQLFLGAELPAIKFVCGWLACSDVSGILAAMATAHEQDQIEPLHSIDNRIWSLLPKKHKAQPEQERVIRFDEQGQRCKV